MYSFCFIFCVWQSHPALHIHFQSTLLEPVTDTLERRVPALAALNLLEAVNVLTLKKRVEVGIGYQSVLTQMYM